MALDKDGNEIPDPQPVAIPPGFKVPETMEQMMRRLLRSPEFRDRMNENENDTFEEAEDFEVDDDTFDPHSPYEEVFDPVLGRGITHDEFVRHRDVYEQRYLDAHERAFAELDKSDALRARPKRGAGVSPADAQKAPKPPPEAPEE